jgi:RNA polymerase sigma-70 factor (ECF subfamily)
MTQDAQLVRELKKGSEQALEALISRYGNRLLRTAAGICGDTQIAEEVVQDTMLQVCRKIHAFEERSSLGTWMFRITVNLAKNRMRGSWLQRLTPWEDSRMAQLPAPAAEEPETQVIKQCKEQAVSRCLQSLPVKYRDVLVLYYVEDFSVAEISAILDEPEGTVKSKMSRGRNLLKEKLTAGGWPMDG